MELSEARRESLHWKLYTLYNKLHDEVSPILRRGIGSCTRISLEITNHQEKETWQALMDANEALVTKFFPAEARLKKHPLYLIPQMIIINDVRDEYYRTFKGFNEYLTNYYAFIMSPKTLDVLRKILDRVNVLAMHYSRLATMRELERRASAKF